MEDRQSTDISSAYFSTTFGKDGSFHVDKPVGSMSISPCGRDVVLASRHGLHIIDLDSPWAPPRHLPHLTPWEVADVQWSPFSSRDFWVVSTSNQKALVWNLAMSTPQASIEHILHAHNRAITDINFSAHHPDVLSTCAVDGFVHCWDLRHPARPAVTFCDWFAGATQVKWNRQDPHIIASSHDKLLHIWDDRKGAHPLRSIEAHSTKIYGIDWNRTHTAAIVTCSLDRTIKFWDYLRSSDEPERIIHTPFPVWRARHTPFGWGLLAMPQRGSNNVHLYDRRLQDDSDKETAIRPVKQFHGHEDQVKEFLWRPRGNIDTGIDNREFQLVTWGNDKTLRLHRLEDQDLANVGYHRGTQVHSKLHFTRQNAPYRTFREDPGKWLGSSNKTTSTGNKPFLDVDIGMEMYRATVGTTIPSPSTADSGWMGGGFVNARKNLRGNVGARKDLDPIAWMKGVKIGKREVLMDQSATSITSPNFRNDRSAEEFEELGEEITHVGSKFSKVEFSEVDVQNRFVKFSLHGPWGTKHHTTYLECRLDFPKDYPNNAASVLRVEKTASVEAATVSKLQSDVKTIGEAFRACQRSSLEALIRYLQGEQSLDEVLAWTKEDQDASVFEFAEDDDNSSSEEGDDMEYPGTQTTDFGLTGSGVLSASNANTNVPLPRTCGAMWSTNGRLVCFFPPKEEKATSLAGSLGLEGPALLLRRRRRIFEGFGRFHKPSAIAKSKASSVGTIESEDTDSEYYSDSSDFSSSTSSVSSRDASSKGQYFGPQHTFRTDIFNFPRADRPTDEAQQSVASGSAVIRQQENVKSIMAIHNLEALLPSKISLARKYVISGPNPCLHNATVSRALGLHDLADVWVTLDGLLKELVPVRTISVNETEEATSEFRVSRALRRQDSGVDLSADFIAENGPQASVKWGRHPLGQSYLIEELYEYFARGADIQMLAMMSCILYQGESGSRSSKFELKKDAPSLESPGSPTGTLYSPAGTTPARTDYFPSIEVAMSVIHAEKPLDASLVSTRARLESTSIASSFGASSSDPTAPVSAGLTPPLSFRSIRRSIDRVDPNSQLISSSPERMRWPQRSASNLTSTFASSLPRPFSFSASASSSPPQMYAKKKSSPMGSLGTSQTQSNAWMSGGPFSRSMSTTDDSKAAAQTLEQRRQRPRRFPRGKMKMSTCLRNQDQFLNDGYADTPLLNEGDGSRYGAFRDAYADMLSIWGLYHQRAEILKHNTDKRRSDRRGSNVPSSGQSQFLLGRKSATVASVGRRRDDIRLCRLCANVDCGRSQRLQMPLKWSKCSACHVKRSAQICNFCSEHVRGRVLPCLHCGHILHTQCRSVVDSTMALGSGECVSGCDCYCQKYTQVRVLWPSMGSLAPHSSTSSTVRGAEEAGPLEDIAYVSLAKNLVPKVSSQKVGQRSRFSSRA